MRFKNGPVQIYDIAGELYTKLGMRWRSFATIGNEMEEVHGTVIGEVSRQLDKFYDPVDEMG